MRPLLAGASLLGSALIGSVLGSFGAGGQLPPQPPALSVVQGPVEADVVRILDGDTVAFYAMPWPEIIVRGTLRMDGIDTPEKNGKCPDEKKKAAEATSFLTSKISAVKGRVKLHVVGLVGEDGGGFGRYRGDVRINNESLSALLIERGLARENHGEKRLPWCANAPPQ